MRRGVLYMVLAGLAFTVMISAVKVARTTLNSWDIIFWRSVLATPLVWLLARGKLSWPMRPGLVLARALFGFAAMSCLFTAARGLTIGDLSVIHKLQPIVIALAAPWVLGRSERAGRVWVAVLLGFLGVAVLIGPDLTMGNAYGLLALCGALLSSAAHLCLRALGQDHHPALVVVAFQGLCIPLSALALVAWQGRMPALPEPRLVAPLVLIAVSAALGQILITVAYKANSAAEVAAASYTAPLWGVLADMAYFHSVPSWDVWVGGLAVVSAGLLLLRGRMGPRPEALSSETT